jgi:hypothetical protein
MELAGLTCAGILNNLWGLESEQEHGCRIPARQATQLEGIGSLESTLGLLKV